jgi:ADP-ribose pyrophosphatase YjhB (NUDIX family)
MTVASEPALRVGARVLLLNHADEVLLIHARDPDHPDHHWWELPGGGQDPGEKLEDTARREIAEETGLVLDEIGRKLWTRESRFTYRGREHHRLDHVYLARTDTTAPRSGTPPTNAPVSSSAAGGRPPQSRPAATSSCPLSCPTSCRHSSTTASRSLPSPSSRETGFLSVDAPLARAHGDPGTERPGHRAIR